MSRRRPEDATERRHATGFHSLVELNMDPRSIRPPSEVAWRLLKTASNNSAFLRDVCVEKSAMNARFPYSPRMAVIGATRAARLAGRIAAIAATVVRMSAASAIVGASAGVMP
jgi:hypothetical protein